MVGLLLPFGLAAILSLTLSGVDEEGEFRATFGVADLDRGELSDGFVELLRGLDFVTLRELASAERADALTDEGELDAAFVIPAGFSERAASGGGGELRVLVDPDESIPRLIAVSLARSFASEIDAVRDILGRGASVGDVLPELGVLLAYAAVLLGVAVVLFPAPAHRRSGFHVDCGAMTEPRIVVRAGGPYRVEGGVSLLRTAIVRGERGQPVAWEEGPSFEVPQTYELCRCGHSETKPFCDKTHETIGFEGRETADRGPIAARRGVWEGDGVVLYDDVSICAHHAFCTAGTSVWELLEEIDDPDVREEFETKVRNCPSGRLAYAVAPDPEPVEQVFEPSIGVEPDGSLWIRGGIPVVSEDGTPYEVRNRQTLCRCGRSHNKPFCDGTHKQVGFEDPVDVSTPAPPVEPAPS